MSDKKKRNIGLGVSIWIVTALVLLILFVVKRDDIFRNLKETAFFDRVFGTTPSFVRTEEDTAEQHSGQVPVEPENTPVPVQPSAPVADTTLPQTDVPADSTPAVTEPANKTQPAKPDTAVEQPAAKPARKPITDTRMNSKLCFVQIDTDGSVNRREITRPLAHTDTPLASSIQALIGGPLLDEQNKGCMTLIPKGTKLLSASVKDGIATLSFSEEFEYNSYGVEGYLGQLMQIVYTATAFSSVDSVQFLLEGQKKEYLGSEGVWIGSPLGRSSFK